jgi:hypothetical protein
LGLDLGLPFVLEIGFEITSCLGLVLGLALEKAWA